MNWMHLGNSLVSIAECVYVVVLASSIKQLTNPTLTLFDSYEFQVIMIFQHVGVVSSIDWITIVLPLKYNLGIGLILSVNCHMNHWSLRIIQTILDYLLRAISNGNLILTNLHSLYSWLVCFSLFLFLSFCWYWYLWLMREDVSW